MQKEVTKLEELGRGVCTRVGVLQGGVSWAWSLEWGLGSLRKEYCTKEWWRMVSKME